VTLQPVERLRERRDVVWLLNAALRHDSSRVRIGRYARATPSTGLYYRETAGQQIISSAPAMIEILALELGRAEPKADGSSEPHQFTPGHLDACGARHRGNYRNANLTPLFRRRPDLYGTLVHHMFIVQHCARLSGRIDKRLRTRQCYD
jgi:hypothetical protein